MDSLCRMGRRLAMLFGLLLAVVGHAAFVQENYPRKNHPTYPSQQGLNSGTALVWRHVPPVEHTEPISAWVTASLALAPRNDTTATTTTVLFLSTPTENSHDNIPKNKINPTPVPITFHHLKRNLLQEVLKGYKHDLYELMETTGVLEFEIVTVLANLVSACLSRKTTNFHLLQGTWSEAYRSEYSTVADLQDCWRRRHYNRIRLLMEHHRSSLPPSNRLITKTFQDPKLLWKRHFLVVQPDQINWVTARLSGLFRKCERFDVAKSTRRWLQTQPAGIHWMVGGFIARKTKKPTMAIASKQVTADILKRENVEIIYLDADLCIIAEGEGPTKQKSSLDRRSYVIYTKNEAWLRPRTSLRRLLVWIMDAVIHHGLFRLYRQRKNSPRSRLPQYLVNDPELRKIYTSQQFQADLFTGIPRDEWQQIARRMNALSTITTTNNGGSPPIDGTSHMTQLRSSSERIRTKAFFHRPKMLSSTSTAQPQSSSNTQSA